MEAKRTSKLKRGANERAKARSQQRVVRRHRWTIDSYRRNAIPNTGWRVMQANGLLIMSELTKEAARRLADDHNRCLSPNAALCDGGGDKR